MNILYVTRHFNHSGYLILKKLIDDKFTISAILLHKSFDFRKVFIVNILFKFMYYIECKYYRCEPLKTLHSEELLAKRNNIKIIYTKTIKSDQCYNDIVKLNPDLIVLGGGWHELIPERIYKLPALGCINTHPSLLPEFRGTSITRWQVFYGIKISGSTIHYVDGTFDTGSIISQKEFILDKIYSPQELFYKLGEIGSQQLPFVLKQFEKVIKLPIIRINKNSIYCKYYSKWKWNIEQLKINWNSPFEEINNFVYANTQESYKYLGPIFSIGNSNYFLRKCSLIAHKDFLTYNDDNIYVHNIINGYFYLARRNDNYYLVIMSVQIYDKYYKFRRSNKPIYKINLSKDDVWR